MARLVVVHHSPTRTLRALTDAVLEGARHPDLAAVEVVETPALATGADDLLAADGYVLVTSANFGYMSGALKHMFDSTFLHVGGALGADGSAAGGDRGPSTSGRPYGLVVHGRYDTEGATRSVRSVVSALGWRQSAPTLEALGDLTDEHLAAAGDLGATLAAVLT